MTVGIALDTTRRAAEERLALAVVFGCTATTRTFLAGVLRWYLDQLTFCPVELVAQLTAELTPALIE